jgi:CRP-like cAMP-binding protein
MTASTAMDGSSGLRATRNLFLDNLPDAAWQALRPLLHAVQLESDEVLHAPRATIRYVFFPINSIVSVVAEMPKQKTLEVGIIGREAMTGLALALGQSTVTYRHVVQVPDSALRISVKDFRATFQSEPKLNALLLRYAQATIASTSQSAACNSLHGLNERCARWLLMAHDRVDGDVINLTQHFLSQMLGVRRAGVTVAAASLAKAGLIEYTRGRITIRNRKRLEAAACKCYAVIERDWKGIMGYSASKTRKGESRATRPI